jgi:hypothetical protein
VQFRRYKAKNDGKAPPPEKRLDIQIYGYALGVVGKTLFGWFVLKHYHPATILTASAICTLNYSNFYRTMLTKTQLLWAPVWSW